MDPEAFNRGIWLFLALLAVAVVILAIALLIAMARTPKQPVADDKRHGFDIVESTSADGGIEGARKGSVAADTAARTQEEHERQPL